MKLTKAVIDKASFKGKKNKKGAFSRHVLWDSSLPGFGLRIFPSQKKTFVVFYRVSGRQRFMTVGRYGVLTLDQAKDACKDILVRVSKSQDPLGERQEIRQAETFGELCDGFIENYAKHKKRSWIEDERRIKRCIPISWRQRKIEFIKHKDIETLHSKIGQRSHVEANRTLALISKMFSYARLENPTKGIQKWDEEKRDRWLSHEELLMLRGAIQKEPNLYMRSLIWLYLLTGVRKSELLKAKWSDLDIEKSLLLLPKTKNGKPFVVALSTLAVEILRHLPKVQGNPFVFPGGKIGQHLVNIYKPWYRILEDASLKDVQIRDLRRSFASMGVQRGESLQLVSKLLNHSNTRTTEIYAHLADTQARDAVERQSISIREILGEGEI